MRRWPAPANGGGWFPSVPSTEASLRVRRRRLPVRNGRWRTASCKPSSAKPWSCLPDPLRAVFCLREIEGLSTEQTADALDLSVENVRVRLHRAKRGLRQTLDERIGREVRRLYLFDGARCDRVVEKVFSRLLPEG